jgi:hypothetical protein
VAEEDSPSSNSPERTSPEEPTALSSDGDGSSFGHELPDTTNNLVTEPPASSVTEVQLPPSQPRKNKTWRGDWQIAVVIAAVIAILAGVLWLHNNSHKARRPIALPSTLLSVNRDTSSAAKQFVQNLVANEQAQVAGLGKPVAALYGETGTGGFSVLVGTPCAGGSSCISESSQQAVQDERAHGYSDAAAFPPGPAGGNLICSSIPGHGDILQCTWIDQVSQGVVVFLGGFASSLTDAAAKTRKVRETIEQ